MTISFASEFEFAWDLRNKNQSLHKTIYSHSANQKFPTFFIRAVYNKSLIEMRLK